MKTPIQQLIDFMDNGVSGNNPFEIKRYAKSIIQKEKECIESAYASGVMAQVRYELLDVGLEEASENYYNYTFNNG